VNDNPQTATFDGNEAKIDVFLGSGSANYTQTALVGESDEISNALYINLDVDIDGDQITVDHSSKVWQSLVWGGGPNFAGIVIEDVNDSMTAFTNVTLSQNNYVAPWSSKTLDSSHVSWDDDHIFVDLNGVGTEGNGSFTLDAEFA
jgi:hypothetical protein